MLSVGSEKYDWEVNGKKMDVYDIEWKVVLAFSFVDIKN